MAVTIPHHSNRRSLDKQANRGLWANIASVADGSAMETIFDSFCQTNDAIESLNLVMHNATFAYRIKFHQFSSTHLFLLIQRNEFNVCRTFSIIKEWSLNGVQIMCTNSDQCSLPANILMEFILLRWNRRIRFRFS